MKPLKVALLGCGTVGSAVLKLIEEQSEDLAARIGRPVEVAGIAAPVEIVRDNASVPHIFGTADADVFFALG